MRSRVYERLTSAAVVAAAALVVGSGCEHLPPADPAAAPVVVHISPDRPWTDTGLAVRKGERYYITATGEIFWATRGVTAGADGIKGEPLFIEDGGLIGRVSVDGSKTFDVGSRTHPFPYANTRSHATHPPTPIEMPATGTLWLGFKHFMTGSNSGGFDVTIHRSVDH